jgi:hypothetical protein
MKQTSNKSVDTFLHPFVFALKEGKEINSNFLDYSLLLLQVGRADVLPSPHRSKKTSTPVFQLLRK